MNLHNVARASSFDTFFPSEEAVKYPKASDVARGTVAWLISTPLFNLFPNIFKGQGHSGRLRRSETITSESRGVKIVCAKKSRLHCCCGGVISEEDWEKLFCVSGQASSQEKHK